ncbi:MAG: hypothetical protein V4813_00930 [Gemmatimonadota bacterium]
MLIPDGRPTDQWNDPHASVFQLLGGELTVLDPWTRVDFSSLHDGAARTQDAVGYRGLTAAYRVAGLTLGDADAAPMCPPFLVEILEDRLQAQVIWEGTGFGQSPLAACDQLALNHWAAGSLTKNLRVVRFGDGDVGLESELHLGLAPTSAQLREFVTAFSWDVAALNACETAGVLEPTEEWIRRAALSISRSTPSIPLRQHPSPDWHAFESPRGVFCSLQPSGGLAESDNVLYAVRRDSAALEPVVTMPGHRNDWDYTRLVDVWLARDGAAAFARTLLCAGFVHTGDGVWRAIETAAISAVAMYGSDGFLLGLHDGKVLVLDGAQSVGSARRLGKVSGRFLQLVSTGTRAIGLVGTTLVSGRLAADASARPSVTDAWSLKLEAQLTFERVAEIDVDAWAQSPAVSVLGDDGIIIIDAETGKERSRFTIGDARHARWIGTGWLMVLAPLAGVEEPRTQIRVLDVVSGRWTEPVITAEVTRLAVRGDEIQVGYANQSIAVWDRAEVCRGIGAVAFITPAPGDAGCSVTPATPAPAPTSVSQGIART